MYLQIKQINKNYGTKRVVADVDLTMEEGEILSLLGPSGCGKTTVLRMIAGLVTPSSGWIKVGGRVFYDGKREIAVEERQIGMVFQDYALWPHMTVEKNIAFGMRLRHMPASKIKKKVGELLDLVNLPGMRLRYPYQLSGGQQQRVAVARALATEPRLLLLDEPFSSLDAGLRESMRTELVQLFRRLGITAINVTHDQDEAMSMSDRIMILQEGAVKQVGTPTDLYLSPASAFVASFIGHANMLPGEIMPTSPDADTASFLLDEGTDNGEKINQQIVMGRVNRHVRGQLNGKALLIFRPEDVLVHQEACSFIHANMLEGKVVHTSFVGGQWRTLIVLDKVQSVQVLAFPRFQPQIGQRLWLELPSECCQIVPR